MDGSSGGAGRSDVRKRSLVILGVAVILILLGIFLLLPPAPAPVPEGGPLSPTPTTVTPAVSGGERTPAPTTPSPSATMQETPMQGVDFRLDSGEPVSCGLTCRQLSATITNTGTATAHTVCITVSLKNSRNEVINLNGNPAIHQCIGDIGAGEKKTEPVTVEADCGAFATKCLGGSLILQTEVSSDERTVQFPDQVIAV